MKSIQLKAYEVMGNPDYYNCNITFGNSSIVWECQNYTKNGKIRFARIIPLEGLQLKVISKYVNPEDVVNVIVKD